MAKNGITTYSPAEFIYALSNVSSADITMEWTAEWLEARGLDRLVKRVKGLEGGNSKEIKIGCIQAVMSAQKGLAAKAGMSGLSAEERSERAKKAVQARIKKYGR